MKYLLITIVALLPFLTYSQNYYAVLITGDTPNLEADGHKNWNGGEERELGWNEFWNDTYLMWELLYDNGFSNDNIFVLFGNGVDWDDPEDNPRYDPLQHGFDHITDYHARISDVENIFTWLANGNPGQGIPQLTAEDVLFVWTFGHGEWLGGCTSTLCLMDGQMIDYDFAALVDQVACSKRIFWMQQCSSGGFVDDLENNKTSILTACDCDEDAWTADDIDPDGTDPLENEIYNGVTYHHGEYNYHVMNAVRKMTIVNNPIATDSNNDGEVSFLESKNWEFLKDSRPETPQWSDIGSKGGSSFVNILMDLSYQNKSTYQLATAYNNGRRLVKDGSENYHVVFASGGEIFYHKTTDGGNTWLSAIRVSDGNGNNNYPSITQSGGRIYSTWQKYLGSNNYDIYFAESTNGGTTWGNKYVLSSETVGSDPLPVIQAYSNYTMVVFRYGNGIKSF